MLVLGKETPLNGSVTVLYISGSFQIGSVIYISYSQGHPIQHSCRSLSEFPTQKPGSSINERSKRGIQ